MTHVAVLADDTTGALEIGGLLAAAGIDTGLFLDAGTGPWARTAVVIDTQTRHLAAEDARQTVATLGARLRDGGIAHCYKKTDSTLRGNIGAELDGLLAAFPDLPLVYVPAYPKLGRTVRDGVLLVRGVPVADTDFRDDPRYPVLTSSVPELLAATARSSTVHESDPSRLDLRPGAIHVFDAESDEDLEALANALRQRGWPYLAAGAGGYASYWIRNLPVPRAQRSVALRANSLLVVCGSLHPASRRQTENARAAGLPVLATPLEISPHINESKLLVNSAASLIAADKPEALIVFGGETARAMFRELGCSSITPLGELLPGVPVAEIDVQGRRTLVVTKAGGFGDDDLVAAIRDRLAGTE